MFTHDGNETFNPEYGGVNWKHRLNNWAEEHEVNIEPVYYNEDDKPKMQVTQENTFVMMNLFADEMDCIAVNYNQDQPEGRENAVGTYYFRERFEDDEHFKAAIHMLGGWALTMLTMYPMEEIVDAYEKLHEVPDELPDDWLDN